MNPFKKNGQMTPVASINSVYIDNTKASDLFRPTLLIETIKQYRDILGFSTDLAEVDVLNEFNNALVSDFEQRKTKAIEIATDYGKRLAAVIKTLYRPSPLSIQNRTNWTEEHWDYWKTIKQIYLVGGLTSPLLTKIFYQEIQQMFEEEQISNVNVTFVEGSSNLGTMGLASITGDGEFLLFDFGQTMIKRAHHIKKNGLPVVDVTLDSFYSDYLFYKHHTHDDLVKIAEKLHEYIVAVILETIKETGFKGNEIYMAIANYVDNGKIYVSRGGYGKLAFLKVPYQSYLSESISSKEGRNIAVTLFHDTSAMALNFTDSKNTAVLSLGTAFGVSFID